MTMYSLTYDGYWRAQKASSIPEKSGVYSVYTCRYDISNRTVSLQKLVYIGESLNVRNRIAGHERIQDWQRHLKAGEELCFNFAPITTDRKRVEAALINHHKPAENNEFTSSFTFPETTVSTSGNSSKLTTKFTVRPKSRLSELLY